MGLLYRRGCPLLRVAVLPNVDRFGWSLAEIYCCWNTLAVFLQCFDTVGWMTGKPAFNL